MAHIEYHPENGTSPWVVRYGLDASGLCEGSNIWFACRLPLDACRKLISLHFFKDKLPIITSEEHLAIRSARDGDTVTIKGRSYTVLDNQPR